MASPACWCRVCLKIDVRMHWVGNTRLLELYEKLSGTKLNAEDGRPHTICYICYSKLQRCYRFSDMCHKSEQFQRERSLADGLIPLRAISHNLAVTPLRRLSIISNQYLKQIKTEVKVKEEPIDIEESTLVEDVADNDNTISSEQPPVKVTETETNNLCGSLYCDVCNKTFAEKRKLVKHMWIHFNKNQYTCNICSKSFSKGSNLISHKKTHTGKKTYDCNICNKSLSKLSHLIAHKRIHTGEKPYACNICNKSFSQRSSLIPHKRIHTGEKPHACNICNKSFSQRGSLVSHKKIHTGEKPYACNICNKSFALSFALTTHKRIHTGERPYVCNICNKSFSICNNLARHKKIHTGEKS